jgi:osmotically-inducible protein OsmY
MSSTLIGHSSIMRPRRLRSLLANSYAAPDLELEPGKNAATESSDRRSFIQAGEQFADTALDGTALDDTALDDVSMAFRRQLEQHPQFRGRGRLVYSEFHDGVLRLSGCLPSFYLKQQVQALAHRTAGVSRVVNRIDVRDAVSRDCELETCWIGEQPE